MEIATTAKQLANPAHDPAYARLSNKTNGRQLIADADTLLFATIDKKIGTIAAIELKQAQANVRARADVASARFAEEITALGFPKNYLDAMIYFDAGNTTQAFLTLRQVTAVLISQGKLGVSSAKIGDAFGLRTKAAGFPSVVYGLRLDGGELFLTQFWEGDSVVYFDNNYKSGAVAVRLKQLLDWPVVWVPGVMSVEEPPAKPPQQSVGAGGPAPFATVPASPLTPDDIARRLDRANELKRK